MTFQLAALLVIAGMSVLAGVVLVWCWLHLAWFTVPGSFQCCLVLANDQSVTAAGALQTKAQAFCSYTDSEENSYARFAFYGKDSCCNQGPFNLQMFSNLKWSPWLPFVFSMIWILADNKFFGCFHAISSISVCTGIWQVNTVPIIAKSDTIAKADLTRFKARVSFMTSDAVCRGS